MAAEQSPDGYLFDLYRKYIGEPDDETDVYVGFGLFLAGIGLAAIALVLFLWASQFETRTTDFATWMQPAIAMGMLSLPAVMLGIVVLLPSERRVRYTSVGGLVVTVVAVGAFLWAYPDHWWGVGDDYTVEVAVVYAVGLAGITASTGAALIAHYLELASYVEYVERPVDEPAQQEREHYTDEEIREDIDAAMEGVELTWGGVEKMDSSKLEFTQADFEGVEIDFDAKTVRTSGGVDAQVAGLKGLKGGEATTTTSSGSTVDDQTAKLRELREQQRAEEVATAEDESTVETVTEEVSGVLDRIRQWIRRD